MITRNDLIVDSLKKALKLAKSGVLQQMILVGSHDDGGGGSAYFARSYEDARELALHTIYALGQMHDDFTHGQSKEGVITPLSRKMQ